MNSLKASVKKIDWITAIKAFAILAIALNHLMEEFYAGPWFTNPSDHWPNLDWRMNHLLPYSNYIPLKIIKLFGWLGDSGPGVFILASGITLTLSYLNKNTNKINFKSFIAKRLNRIFPLYIFLHIIFIGFPSVFLNNDITFNDPKVFLSLLGLRFNDQLFFFINPSWWFIWLILQLYLIFPFLFQLLRKWNIKKFFFITLLFTIVSRSIGILGLGYTKDMYYWLTGAFFGSRLAEFAVGMIIGKMIWKYQQGSVIIPTKNLIYLLSVLSYLSGLFLSITKAGSLLSNLLITCGMSGLFYFFWNIFAKYFPFLKKIILWIGINSYSFFIVHQPILKWTSYLPERKSHFITAVLSLVISFPLAFILEKLVNYIIETLPKKLTGTVILKLYTITINLILVIVLIAFSPLVSNYKYNQIINVFLFALLLYLIYYEIWLSRLLNSRLISLINYSSILTVTFKLFFLSEFAGNICGIALISLFLLIIIFSFIFKTKWTVLIFSVFSLVILLFIFEGVLSEKKPIAITKWGEYPALQQHPTRIYSLIPNKTTHLKYNDYNYKIVTNNEGLAGEEIPIQKTDSSMRILIIGDAFAMPEGLDYKYSFPFLMQKILENELKPYKIEIINGGVTGYGPMEQLPQLIELGNKYKPDLVIYEFFINEFIEASMTKESRLKNIGFIKDDQAPVFPDNTQLALHTSLNYSDIEKKLTGKPGRYDYFNSFLYLYEKNNNKLYDYNHCFRLEQYLKEMKKFCDQSHFDFFIAFVPAAIAVTNPEYLNYYPLDKPFCEYEKYDVKLPFKHLKAITNKYNIKVLNLSDDLKSNGIQPVYFPYAWHWNKEGHIVAARSISTYILNNYFNNIE